MPSSSLLQALHVYELPDLEHCTVTVLHRVPSICDLYELKDMCDCSQSVLSNDVAVAGAVTEWPWSVRVHLLLPCQVVSH
jgi:hypothetical protein